MNHTFSKCDMTPDQVLFFYCGNSLFYTYNKNNHNTRRLFTHPRSEASAEGSGITGTDKGREL
jgi:hypothetical protein